MPVVVLIFKYFNSFRHAIRSFGKPLLEAKWEKIPVKWEKIPVKWEKIPVKWEFFPVKWEEIPVSDFSAIRRERE